MTSTHVSTDHLVRDDVERPAQHAAPAARPSKGWAFAGLGAGVAALGGGVAGGMLSAVYDPEIADDAAKISERLGELTNTIVAFHVLTTLAAVLLVVFAAGLFRRLRQALPADSILPGVAAAGLVTTAGVLVLGTGLDTEFLFEVGRTDNVAASSAMYNHWVGTIPACWVLAGLAGVALFAASRAGAVARWVGVVGLVLGSLTVVLGVSPVQYMAGLTGALWLVVTASALAFGDKAARR